MNIIIDVKESPILNKVIFKGNKKISKKTIEVSASKDCTMKTHKRTINKWRPHIRCKCSLPENCNPAKFPNLSIAEKFF